MLDTGYHGMLTVLHDNSRRSAYSKRELTEMSARVDAIDALRVKLARLRWSDCVRMVLLTSRVKKVWEVKDFTFYGKAVFVDKHHVYVLEPGGGLAEVSLHRLGTPDSERDKLTSRDLQDIAHAL